MISVFGLGFHDQMPVMEALVIRAKTLREACYFLDMQQTSPDEYVAIYAVDHQDNATRLIFCAGAWVAEYPITEIKP